MRNAFSLELRRWLIALVLAAGCMAPSLAATKWETLLEKYKQITNNPPREAWATNMARAFVDEYPEWATLSGVGSESALTNALHQPPAKWRWDAASNAKPGEVPRAYFIKWAPAPEMPENDVLLLGARDRDEWIWINPVFPGASSMWPRDQIETFLGKLHVAETLYFQHSVSIADSSHGRVLQRDALNSFVVKSSGAITTRVSQPNLFHKIEIARVAAGSDVWTVAGVPTNDVRTPFSIDILDAGSTNRIDSINNLVVGDVWLLAGAPMLTKTAQLPAISLPDSIRYLWPETHIASRPQSTVPLRGGWMSVDEQAPLLAVALAQQWETNAATTNIPLGLVLVSAGAADIQAWQKGVNGAVLYNRSVDSLWISELSTEGDRYQPGDIFHGTLSALLPSSADGRLTVTGAFWWHGEWVANSNLNSGDLRKNYSNELGKLITDWRQLSSTPLRFVVAQTRRPSSAPQRAEGTNDPWWQIQMAQFDVVGLGAAVASFADLPAEHERGLEDFQKIASRLHPWLADPALKMPSISRSNGSDGVQTNITLSFSEHLSTNAAGTFLIERPLGNRSEYQVFSGTPLLEGTGAKIKLSLPQGWRSAGKIRHLGGIALTNLAPLPVFSNP